MSNKEISKINDQVVKLIESKRLRDAMNILRTVGREQKAYDLIEKVEAIDATYQLMLHYLSKGTSDPERDEMYAKIVLDLYIILDKLIYNIRKADDTSQYFSTVRLFERSPRADRITSLLNRCGEIQDQLSLFTLIADQSPEGDTATRQREIENVQSDLFTCIWATPALSANDSNAIQTALNSETYSADFKSHIISSLTMGMLQHFDSRKLELLLDAYANQEPMKVKAAALVGILLSLWSNGQRPISKKLAAHLATVKDTAHWQTDLKIATIELIRARDTERINKKITDEVIPSMLNLRPELMNKINNGEIDANDMAGLQENPEWQELLDKNGITDKLKELSEMQMNGGDVMMSTFAHLKSFPFFNTMSNWFLPYNSNHSLIAEQSKNLGITSEMLENATFLCDSDKYSFMFAIKHVPEEQRRLMTSQFQSQSDAIYEAMSEMEHSTHDDSIRRAVNQYIQNIYRFFKLYRRKDEFTDPFDSGLNLVSLQTLSKDFQDIDMLQVISEFYLKLGYWADALEVMSRLTQLQAADAQMKQKMGYCQERLGNLPQAADLYQQAELMDTESTWTIKRLAVVMRALGRKKEALNYYRQLAQRKPEDLSVALMLGYSLLENGQYEDAAKQFYKVEFLDDKSNKSWRPLAWTLLLNGDYDASMRYFNKVLLDNPTPNDYLNMGHLNLAIGNMNEAINYYKLALQEGLTPEQFIKALDDDHEAMKQAGVHEALIPLVADAVMYSLN